MQMFPWSMYTCSSYSRSIYVCRCFVLLFLFKEKHFAFACCIQWYIPSVYPHQSTKVLVSLLPSLILLSSLFWDIIHVDKDGWKFTIWLRLYLNHGSSCILQLNAEIMSMSYHMWAFLLWRRIICLSSTTHYPIHHVSLTTAPLQDFGEFPDFYYCKQCNNA